MNRSTEPLIPPLFAGRLLVATVVIVGIYFLHGFLVPVLAALVIGFASWPLYVRLCDRMGGNTILTASIAILLLLVFLIVPITIATLYAIGEVGIWFHWIVQLNRTGAEPPDWIANVPAMGEWLQQQWALYLGRPGGISELVQVLSGENVRTIYQAVITVGYRVFDGALTLIFMLIVLFFVFRQGEMLVEQLDRIGAKILPLRWERLSRIVPLAVRSAVLGMTLIAIGEGIVLGVAYWLAGAPSPATLGVLTAIMALVPGGAPLSMTLVSIYVATSGSPFAGIALFSWGTLELFIVDKTIRPKLVGGPISLPFLPTFFGLIGGVKTMGFLGLFVGPVLMAILVALWRDWVEDAKDEPAQPLQATDEREKVA
ncbi:AI-2E family transporter [Acuticoccus sp. M5D2P5]|uniref:AI-2E family transporter n=1 Tax=Acuticoccus kalidii TaxID=2910977 RepID=UPI001F417D3D|nr:AI-2E family transporter [Acuticoccus kalidii]MCF3935688.1 AI-2E family transporter [Acuticoccus kalidii]